MERCLKEFVYTFLGLGNAILIFQHPIREYEGRKWGEGNFLSSILPPPMHRYRGKKEREGGWVWGVKHWSPVLD